MNLKSFGCSFIFGTDLPDDGRGYKFAKPSQYTWPSLMAQHYGYGYHCYAYPGAGNLQIMERTLSQLACNENALYVIGWSWIDRFDYNSRENNKWKTIMPICEDPLATVYYRDLHSQFRDKLTTLSYIKLTIDTLKQKGFPFIMTYMDELIFETKWHSTPAITDMQNYIRPYMTTFDGKNFLDWSRDNGYQISDTSHPLIDAHSAASQYMIGQNLV